MFDDVRNVLIREVNRTVSNIAHRLHACLVIAATGWGGGEVEEPVID